MSMDDDDLDTEILTIESNIEDNADDKQALPKLKRSKELLILRKNML
jgi:hypothetical protein